MMMGVDRTEVHAVPANRLGGFLTTKATKSTKEMKKLCVLGC